jgi:hypothetical protein
VLQDIEQAVYFLTHLKSIGSLTRWFACTFSAYVEEYGPGLVIEILVINPVPLSEVKVSQS